MERSKRDVGRISMKHVRQLHDTINWENRLIAIRGARGVGKTTLMKQHMRKTFGENSGEAFYTSLDNLFYSRHSLTDVVDEFYKRGGKYIFIDEVYKYPTWSIELKNIYDDYPDLYIAFTGSSLLNIINADADLSRRHVPYAMQGLSFREYLMLCENIELPVCSLDDILSHPDDICAKVNSVCRPLKYFEKYLKYGYYPFYLEGKDEYYVRIENVIDMTLEIELPQLCGVDIANVRKLKSLLAVLSSSVPFSVDITKLSTAAGMSRNTVLAYLNYLERAKLIHQLYANNDDIKKMQKPDKIYMENPNLLHVLSIDGVEKGTAREVFFVNQLSYGHRVEYSNSRADFLIDRKYTIEVGGASKDGGQLAGRADSFIAADDIEYALGKKLPLWLFGMLY